MSNVVKRFPCVPRRSTRLWLKTNGHPPRRRPFATSKPLPLASSHAFRDESGTKKDAPKEKKEEGAMSRRLEQMTESSLEEGGESARNVVQEAGFSDELKQRLLDKLEESQFRSENISAFAEANMPSNSGRGSREIAAAKPWTGEEAIEDTALRMLTDAHKPLRRSPKMPGTVSPPKKVNTGRPKRKPSTGIRLASAKERSDVYSSKRDEPLTEKERQRFKDGLREKFQAGARPMPGTLQGLSALVNERIEDAIARGQFKNLPRGKKIERDHNMGSPFIDTTEYFMNKIIQKQDIAPPWIEKQQELLQTVNLFRSQLRASWRRHAARVIASAGGSLESQIRRAEQAAEAEAVVNPVKKKEKLNAVDKDGHLSQITLSGQLRISEEEEADTEMNITVTEEPLPAVSDQADAEPRVDSDQLEAETSKQPGENPRIVGGAVYLFRDPVWEKMERAYLELAVNNLNTMTRSYNLMAPNAAKKPYYSLDRELRACFAEVAPQLPSEIRERSKTQKVTVNVLGHGEGGVLEHFSGKSAKIYDERRPQYGFREFWRDLFGSKEARRS